MLDALKLPAPSFLAFIAGFLPGLIWLAFWLLEDRCQPEPKRYILFAFIAGMIAVELVIPIEQWTRQLVSGPLMYLAWAAAEEIVKFLAAYIAALRTSAFDEPLDAVVYMITAALGFSVLENALFLNPTINQEQFLQAFAMGDLRFVGAMLLHTLASGTLGIMIALAYTKPAHVRKLMAFVGLILAIALHSLFNFSILYGEGALFWVFLGVWICVVVLLLMVERIKVPQRDYC